MHVEFRYKKENAEGEKVMYSNDNYNEIYLAGGCFWGTDVSGNIKCTLFSQ